MNGVCMHMCVNECEKEISVQFSKIVYISERPDFSKDVKH